MKARSEVRVRWTKAARKLLVGRTIVDAGYMTDADAQECGWYRRGVVLQLDDGTLVFPLADDEGNGPGALHTTSADCPILPVL